MHALIVTYLFLESELKDSWLRENSRLSKQSRCISGDLVKSTNIPMSHLWVIITGAVIWWGNVGLLRRYIRNYLKEHNLSSWCNHQLTFCFSSLSSICFLWRTLMRLDLFPHKLEDPSSMLSHTYIMQLRKVMYRNMGFFSGVVNFFPF